MKLKNKKSCPADRQGFTLIELLVVMGMAAIILGLIGVNMIRPINKTAIDAQVLSLVADLKQQQLKAMIGDSEGGGSAASFGIYFETNRYIIFRGMAYSSADPNNFSINMDNRVVLSDITFPGSQIVFSRRSGEVNSASSVTVKNSDTNEQKIITVNKLGVVNIE